MNGSAAKRHSQVGVDGVLSGDAFHDGTSSESGLCGRGDLTIHESVGSLGGSSLINSMC